MSRHKRHLNTLKKLYDAGWFVVMAKPAYRTGASEVYLGMHKPCFSRQLFVHAGCVGTGPGPRSFYAPPIRTGEAMFVLRKWKGEKKTTETKEGWGELAKFASKENEKWKNQGRLK